MAKKKRISVLNIPNKLGSTSGYIGTSVLLNIPNYNNAPHVILQPDGGVRFTEQVNDDNTTVSLASIKRYINNILKPPLSDVILKGLEKELYKQVKECLQPI